MKRPTHIPVLLIEVVRKYSPNLHELSAEDAVDALWLATIAPSSLGDPTLPSSSNVSSSSTQGAAPDAASSSADQETLSAARPDSASSGDHAEQPAPEGAPQPEEAPHLLHSTANGRLIGAPLRVSSATALPDKRGLLRAIRPIIRRAPSQRWFEVDYERTVCQAAEEDAWEPCLRPRTERWLHLDIIIEKSSSVALFQPLLAELVSTLKSSGAFAAVRCFTLDSASNGALCLYKGWSPKVPHGTQKVIQPHHLSRGIQPRAVWLLTDCASDAWYGGQVGELLHFIGLRVPLAIVHLLPSYLVERTAVGIALPLWLHATKPLSLGSAIQMLPRHGSMPQIENLLATPSTDGKLSWGAFSALVALEPRSLRSWARYMIATNDNRIMGLAWPRCSRADFPAPDGAMLALAPLTPYDRVRCFRATATRAARQLAILLTEFPLVSLPIMRLVRAVFLPSSRYSHESEVLLGELLEISASSPIKYLADDPDKVLYDFVPGVRELLMKLPWPGGVRVPRPSKQELMNRIGMHIERNAGNRRNFEVIVQSLDAVARGFGEFALLTSSLRKQQNKEKSPSDHYESAWTPRFAFDSANHSDPHNIAPHIVVIDEFYPDSPLALRKRPFWSARSRSEVNEILANSPLVLSIGIQNRFRDSTDGAPELMRVEITISDLEDFLPWRIAQRICNGKQECNTELRNGLMGLDTLYLFREQLGRASTEDQRKTTYLLKSAKSKLMSVRLSQSDRRDAHTVASGHALDFLKSLKRSHQKSTNTISNAAEFVDQETLYSVVEEILDSLAVTDSIIRTQLRWAVQEIIRPAIYSNIEEDLFALSNSLLAELEQKVHHQLDEILHDPIFQKFEARWRGLNMLVDGSDGTAEISVLSASLNEIVESANKDDPDELEFKLRNVGALRHVTAVILGYNMNTGNVHANLLRKLSDAAASNFTPLVANLDPSAIQEDWDTFRGLPLLTNEQILERFSEHTRPEWKRLREHPNARYVGLTLPRVVGRLPYEGKSRRGHHADGLRDYSERLGSDAQHLFVASSYLLGRQILGSYVRTGLPHMICGRLHGGLIEGLAAPKFDASPGQPKGSRAVEVLIHPEQEVFVSNLGLIPVLGTPNGAETFFYSAPSIYLKKHIEKDGQPTDYVKGVSLQNMLLFTRFVHCILEMWHRFTMERYDGMYICHRMRDWLGMFIYPHVPFEPKLADKFPIKDFIVEVRPEPKRPGWYTIDFEIRPIGPYQGAEMAFSISGENAPSDVPSETINY